MFYSEEWGEYIWTYKNWELVTLTWDIRKLSTHSYFNEVWVIYVNLLWNKFINNKNINSDEFEALKSFFTILYELYYGEDNLELFYSSYNARQRYLLTLYSMMNCWGDPLNPDTYLFNLEDSESAQETYFKNCPKWCKYSDKEGIDFVCE